VAAQANLKPNRAARLGRGLDPVEAVPSHAHGLEAPGQPRSPRSGCPEGRVDAGPCRATAPCSSSRSADPALVCTNNKCHGGRSATSRRAKSPALAARILRSKPVAPPEDAPRYVHACHNDEWHLNIRYKDGRPGVRVTYRCNSRHHEGPCRDTWRRRLYARLTGGKLREVPLHHVMFGTLTLPAAVHRMVAEGRPEEKAELIRAQHDAIGTMIRRLTRTLNARAKRAGFAGMDYFWFREAHKSGTPHVHLLLISPWLASKVRERDSDPELDGVELGSDDANLAPADLVTLATSIGWGERFDLQMAESREALTHYATKLVGEVSKGSQTPEHMPLKCRSYGGARGFLAPRKVDEQATGWVTDEHGRRLAKVSIPEIEGGWDDQGLAPAAMAERERRADFETATGIPWRGSVSTASGWCPERLAREKAARLAAADAAHPGGVWDEADATAPNLESKTKGWRHAESEWLSGEPSRTYTLRRRPERYSRPPPLGQMGLWSRPDGSDVDTPVSHVRSEHEKVLVSTPCPRTPARPGPTGPPTGPPKTGT